MLVFRATTISTYFRVSLVVLCHVRALALQSHDDRLSLIAPTSLVEEQWGSNYHPVQCSVLGDLSIECVFRAREDNRSESVHSPENARGGYGNMVNRQDSVGASSPTACVYKGKGVDKEAAEVYHTVRGVDTPELCKTTCQNHGECAFAVFRQGDGSCEHMKGMLKLVDTGDEAVVLPSCDGGCLVSGESYSGMGDILGTTPDALLCQLTCRQSPGCSFFVWDSKNRECFSYRDVGVPFVSAKTLVRGPARSCTEQGKAFDYAGSCEEEGITAAVERNFKIRNTETVEKCHKACHEDKRCNWATFNTKSHLCYLKGTRGRHSVVSEADITFPKLCNSSCFRRDSRLKGGAFKDISGTKSPHYCHYECWTTARCHYWNWFAEKESCLLFSVGTGDESTFSPGDWSGKRGGCGEEQKIIP